MELISWLRDYSILWMFAVFVISMAFVFWPGRGRRFEQDANIPLRDDQ